MLEPVVAGAGEHQVGEPQLLEVTQALELGRVCVAALWRRGSEGAVHTTREAALAGAHL